MAALLVGLGGAFGSLLRFGMNLLCAQLGPAWPFATTIVNVLGSFGLAFASRTLVDRTWLGVPLIWTIGTGIMGGFTTYSSFNLEIMHLFQRGDAGRAVAYVCVTLVSCLAAGVLGFWCASRVAL